MKQIRLLGLLVLMGAGWGLSGVIAKPIVDAGYRPFGIILWQMIIGAIVLGALTYARGKPLPFAPRHIALYLFIALTGTLLPNVASYTALLHLPAGIMSIIIASVSMFAFPIALLLGNERFEGKRFLGLVAGLIGVVILAGPQAQLPTGAWIWIAVALIAPFLYGIEGNVIAKWGTAGLDPIQALAGASLIGACLALGMTLATDAWIDPLSAWNLPKGLIVVNSILHACVYSGYVWLVGRAGATFAAQVSYLVTGFGVVWAMILLGESYGGWVWVALGVMFVGLFLVQPHDTTEHPSSEAA